jgi:hypothetical protein
MPEIVPGAKMWTIVRKQKNNKVGQTSVQTYRHTDTLKYIEYRAYKKNCGAADT